MSNILISFLLCRIIFLKLWKDFCIQLIRIVKLKKLQTMWIIIRLGMSRLFCPVFV